MNSDGTRCVADSMHVGVVCPGCQKPISFGTEVVICHDCSTLAHAECWDKSGCESYHCRGGSVETTNIQPDLILRKEEVATVVMPGRGRMFTTESLAGEIDKKGQKTSILSYVVMVIGLGCFLVSLLIVSRTGALSQEEGFIFLAIMISGIITILLGAISWATIQPQRRVLGNIPVLGGVLAATFAMGLSFVTIFIRNDEKEMEPVQFERDQIKDFISTAQASIRGPLKSNVHIAVNHRFAGESRGSGVVVKIVGNVVYIISNLHVLTAGKSVTDLNVLKEGPKPIVTFYNGEKRTAEPIWLAPNGIDLALMKVSAPEKLGVITKIHPNRLLAIGQRVFAIGNPMGLDWSYTEGVISGIRLQHFGRHEVKVIQIQTPLNPGNSGGGLYDQDGFLIGINTWIYAKTMTEGLNFSIAIESLLKVLDPFVLNLLALDSSHDTSGDQNVSQAEAPPSGLQQDH